MEGFMAALTAERAPPLKKFELYGTRMGDGGMTALAEAFREGRLGFSIERIVAGALKISRRRAHHLRWMS